MDGINVIEIPSEEEVDFHAAILLGQLAKEHGMGKALAAMVVVLGITIGEMGDEEMKSMAIDKFTNKIWKVDDEREYSKQ